MPERSIKALKKGRASAMEKRRNWEGGWRDAYRFCLPMRDILENATPGQPKGNLVFDSTAISSAANTVSRLVNSLFPPFQDFIELKPGPAIPNEQRDEALRLLQDASDAHHAAVRGSNFNVVVHEFMYELLVGTGVMMFQEGTDEEPYRFIAVPTPMVALEEGAFSGIGAVFRDFDLPVAVIESMWPDIVMPEDWTKLKEEKPTENVKFYEATYLNTDTREWEYKLFREKNDEPLLVKPRKFEFSPWLVARWTKAANEVYGRGPILFALPDIRTVNKVVELILMNASLAVSGVYTGVDDGVFNPNTARITPGAILAVARNEGHPQGPTLSPLPRTGSFDVGQFILDDMRTNIRRLMLDRGLPEPQGTPPSATETIQRIRETASLTGPAFGRIVMELAKPMTMRGLRILDKKGKITFPFTIDDQTIGVEVTSPLANQEGLAEVENLVRWLEVSGIVGPEITALGIKIEDVPKWLGEKFGVDRDLVRDDTSKEEIMQALVGFMQQGQEQPEGAPVG